MSLSRKSYICISNKVGYHDKEELQKFYHNFIIIIIITIMLRFSTIFGMQSRKYKIHVIDTLRISIWRLQSDEAEH